MANKLILHTDRISEEYQTQVDQLLNKIVPADVEVVRYNHNMEISWRDINKYAQCETVADLVAVNPDYKNDLTSEGEWVYLLPNLQNAEDAFAGSLVRKFSVELPSVTNPTRMFRNAALDGEMTLSLPNAVRWSQIFDSNTSPTSQRKLTKITLIGNPDIPAFIHQTFAVWFDAVFDDYLEEVNIFGFTLRRMGADALCRKCRGLKRFRSDLVGQITQWSSEAMSSAQLDKESVLDMVRASYIGDTEHKLAQWGIHEDLKDDAEVKAAIDSLRSYGWEIVVRWNGTPTAQAATTYGLRKPLIYAKVREYEHPDGTTKQYLDWGHYVTDQTGYEEFRSVEAARDHFGLPEEDENLKPD